GQPRPSGRSRTPTAGQPTTRWRAPSDRPHGPSERSLSLIASTIPSPAAVRAGSTGGCGQPIGCGPPEQEEVQGDRQELGRTDEGYQQEERQDGSRDRQRAPPGEGHPEPGHGQGREEEREC